MNGLDILGHMSLEEYRDFLREKAAIINNNASVLEGAGGVINRIKSGELKLKAKRILAQLPRAKVINSPRIPIAENSPLKKFIPHRKFMHRGTIMFEQWVADGCPPKQSWPQVHTSIPNVTLANDNE